MTRTRRIIFTCLIFMTLGSSVQAQYFSDIQQYSTPVLLNPSFVGSTKGDRIYASLQSSNRQDTKAYSQFISHDFYYKKRALGLGYIGGIISETGENLISPFLSLMVSKYIAGTNKRFIIPSLSVGFEQPLKNYDQFYFDRIFASQHQDVLPPGETLTRMTVVTGRLGVLFTDYNGTVGLCLKGMRSYRETQVYQHPDSMHYEVNAYKIFIHAEKIIDYYYRDLLSRDYQIRPRFVLELGNETTQFFGGVTVQRKNVQIGVGYLPNFDSGNARFSINLGYDFKYFKLHYLGSIKDENGVFNKPMHNITLSVIFPELRKYGIPVPGIVRNL